MHRHLRSITKVEPLKLHTLFSGLTTILQSMSLFLPAVVSPTWCRQLFANLRTVGNPDKIAKSLLFFKKSHSSFPLVTGYQTVHQAWRRLAHPQLSGFVSQIQRSDNRGLPIPKQLLPTQHPRPLQVPHAGNATEAGATAPVWVSSKVASFLNCILTRLCTVLELVQDPQAGARNEWISGVFWTLPRLWEYHLC